MSMQRFSSEHAIGLAFSPLKGVPTIQGDVSVTTSSAVLFADATNSTNGYGCRRIRIYNTDASATLGLFFIAAGGTATGLVIANSCKVGPGLTFEVLLSNTMRVAAVGSASLAANVLVHDLI